jgi:O-antigen/teichoic acid export membrane protein
MVGLAVALSFADAGFATATQRSFYDYRDEQLVERKTVVTTGFCATTVAALLVAGILLATREHVAGLLFDRKDETNLITLVALTIPLWIAASFLREVMRLRFRAAPYLVSTVLGAVLSGAVGVVAVLALDFGVEGVFLGIVAGNAAAAAYGAIAVRHDLSKRLSAVELRRMLAFGLPLVPAGLALWGLTFVDRIMLSRLGDLGEVGKYAVASRVSGLINLGVTGFLLALGPYLLSIYSEDRELEKIVRGRALTYLTFGLTLASLCVTVFGREIVSLVAPAYDDAYKALGPLTFSAVAFGLSGIVMAGISLARRTTYFALLAGGAAGINVALNLALIPPFGMVGAAVAAGAAYGCLALAYYLVGQRLYPTPYEPAKVLTMLALAVACAPAGLLSLEPDVLELLLKGLVVGVFVASVRLTGAIGPNEFRELQRFFLGMVRLREGGR